MTKNSSFRAFLFISLFSCVSSASALSSTVYVDMNYTETNAGGHTFGVDAFPTIQNGIDSVAEGGTVSVAKGTYVGNLMITKSLKLSGQNPHTTVGASEDAPMLDGTNTSATILVQGSTTPLTVSISNFHIINGNHGILVVQKAKMQISNNIIDNYGKNGITFGSKIIKGLGEVSGTIDSNIIRGKGTIDTVSQNGIQIAEHNTATISNNTILNNVYADSGRKWATGILIHNTEGVTVSGNSLINNQAGVNILAASKNTISGNTFTGNKSTNAAIMITDLDDDVRPASNNIIDKNVITGGYIGIWASYGPKNRFTNNSISSTSHYGMYFWDSDLNIISNNMINMAAADTYGVYGIALDGGDTKKRTIGSDFNYLSDNTVIASAGGYSVSAESEKNFLVRNKF